MDDDEEIATADDLVGRLKAADATLRAFEREGKAANWCMQADLARVAFDRIASDAKRIRELEEALKPFAKLGSAIDVQDPDSPLRKKYTGWEDHHTIFAVEEAQINCGHIRAARRALESG